MMVAVVLGALATTSANRATAAATGGTPSAKAVTDISKYCQTCWRNARLPADRWQDCTQEVFVRLLERVEADKWGRLLVDDESLERREFIRAIDAVKKRTQRARKFTNLTPDVPERRPVANTLKDDRDAVTKASAELLSPRQRRLLDLTADGWTVPEIADELGTTPERISDEKYKAVKKLQHYFQA
ncbi:dna-directed rna polymerase subunit sigma24 : DNA-directed RNA polymerase specialized sigma subunit, sigma24 OS=Singulisphaera acidiphila (strain ATCC BAA-1392 / DSM 18658 / VKM B-2454 / MOB10) GN=Sinac_5396 PE=4 SV=1: GerE [Gemmataceae bacterium]|nr:dna-directed rna polymerase subunit sigma24 : DNA-directed RNA polymerase specialized sigma subunit, sigma24 OS=Singulisphaera acidiphila (strain ATCC BAA-1392 / DSM 18658 / VKM B-2454 / MOB10) GN=Sinac_5396 PE=4 SV=1: GerE [Gemmataceae bacterium]VTT99435.1 dna-directed rna polymerase subunit sigma24 : DNA-directed RNA polymerase specialized sigma subunit, sigma24 OS=Singulisphaera acidiphila (strain ATCC BAA-1392 / DSM 18658 / VKM B-2454 / MOB10) GN=Sinac_5396 PE=4 SV=1: GerE [Gemmataceae bact